MSTEESNDADKLFLDIIKLQGKLLALQKANTVIEVKGQAVSTIEQVKIDRMTSEAPTELPDESTDGIETPSSSGDEDDVSSETSSDSEEDA